MPDLNTILLAVRTDFPETVRPGVTLVAKTHRKPTFDPVTDANHIKASNVTVTRSTFTEKAISSPRFSDVEVVFYTTESRAEPQDLVWDNPHLYRLHLVEQVDLNYYKWYAKKV
ncbi:hypothetical protein DF3PA_70125 [Candidatus Defluviicoccus seviourii]|uniref:Uncharacterized protein n=1 Tax=Candidatus Defluviicoccus seviourii TaxID=2565273 RepID=A0A564WJI3_9PROT|nr:hypothetical protein DF3PA_70125 [Candidatus Defluviicoccus seviourii]